MTTKQTPNEPPMGVLCMGSSRMLLPLDRATQILNLLHGGAPVDSTYSGNAPFRLLVPDRYNTVLSVQAVSRDELAAMRAIRDLEE